MRHLRSGLASRAAYESERAAIFKGAGFIEIHCPFCPRFVQEVAGRYSDAEMRRVLRYHLIIEHRDSLLSGGAR